MSDEKLWEEKSFTSSNLVNCTCSLVNSMKSFVVGKIFLIVFIGLVQTFTLKALKILVIFSVKPAKYVSTTNSFLSLLEKLTSLI